MFDNLDKMDHAAYKAKVRTMDEASLRFVCKDAAEAIAANPANPKVGYYADEILYCADELRRRGIDSV